MADLKEISTQVFTYKRHWGHLSQIKYELCNNSVFVNILSYFIFPMFKWFKELVQINIFVDNDMAHLEQLG
jgi:hypothetical protein